MYKRQLIPVLVRVANRDYAGLAGAGEPARESDAERAVRALFSLPDDDYVPPA